MLENQSEPTTANPNNGEFEIELTDRQVELLEAVEGGEFNCIFFGGAKGGGKSFGLRAIILTLLFERPGTTAAIFRRTYEELEGNHIRKLFSEYPELMPYYQKSERLLTLPNGSTLEFCHCRRYEDVFLYQGREFELLGIDEAGQWTEDEFQTLRGSNRTSRIGAKCCTILTGNPGGVGHGWLKRIFLDRDFNTRERPRDYYFIPARLWDNPALCDADPEYVARLEAEPNEALRRAYLEGDWDIFVGQYFGTWRREIHVVEPFELPGSWRRYICGDYGFTAPSAVYWVAIDHDGVKWVYRELYASGLTYENLKHRIRELTPVTENSLIDYMVFDPAIFAKSQGTGVVGAEVLSDGLPWGVLPGDNNRIEGWRRMREELDPMQAGGPRLRFFSTCREATRTIPQLVHDRIRAEDVDTACEDHAGDAIRYGLMSRPTASRLPPAPPPATPDEKIRAWQQARLARHEKRNKWKTPFK
ncbi:MAG TPA: terminase family protein [Elusimicrobiales bacterium]|nr:terminase family protein [Elusimicrobiales bacterium]